MSRQITRLNLSATQDVTVRHARGALRHFGIIGGTPAIWVEELDEPGGPRHTYRVVSTGDPIPEYATYLKTAQDPNGIAVHLFTGDLT